jgi:hypothetical protein
MLEPHGSWKAPALKVEMGTEQIVASTIEGLEPSQEVASIE